MRAASKRSARASTSAPRPAATASGRPTSSGARQQHEADRRRHTARERRRERGERRTEHVRVVDHDPQRRVDVAQLVGERRRQARRLGAVGGERQGEPAGVGPQRAHALHQRADERAGLPRLRVVPGHVGRAASAARAEVVLP